MFVWEREREICLPERVYFSKKRIAARYCDHNMGDALLLLLLLHAHTNIPIHSQTNSGTHKKKPQTQTQTHTHSHRHTHTRKYTHTHVHTLALVCTAGGRASRHHKQNNLAGPTEPRPAHSRSYSPRAAWCWRHAVRQLATRLEAWSAHAANASRNVQRHVR